jgi:hypothetical protein
LDQAEHLLTVRQHALGLTESERLMLRNVHFRTCSVLLDMEQYEQVIPRLNTIATMYQNRAEALEALTKMGYALRMVGKKEEELQTFKRAMVVLDQLEKTGAILDGTKWRNAIQEQMRR